MISEAELKEIEEALKRGWHMKGRTKIYIPASSCDIAGSLLTELRACREALRFYASKETYWGKEGEWVEDFPIDADEGKRAREALGEEK